MQNYTGSKYDSKLTTTQISKLVREDIKAAIKSGELSKAKYSVRTQYYSMGSSIDITVKDVSFNVLNEERFLSENPGPVKVANSSGLSRTPKYSEAGSQILEKLTSILHAYNRDSSDHMTDYFNVHFSAHVRFDCQMETTMRKDILNTPSDLVSA